MIYSYDDCVALFSRVRSPKDGKPLIRNIRLFKNPDNSFRLVYLEHRFANIATDNTVTFVMSLQELSDVGLLALLPYRLHKILPLSMLRMDRGRYRIGVTRPMPEYYGGITFDLDTRVCTNPKPDAHKRVNPDARKLWLRTLKAYRIGLFARLKLGVRGTASRDGILIHELAQWMKSGEYPHILFYTLHYRAGGWGRTPSYDDLTEAFVNLIQTNSTLLRREFGVFIDD